MKEEKRTMFIEETESGDIKFHPWHFVFAALGIVVFSIAIAWVGFGYNVFTSKYVGQGQAHIQKESVQNRIASQHEFANDLTDIVKFNQQYNDATKAVADWDAAHPDYQSHDNALGTLANQRQKLVDEARGIQQQCQNTIQRYASAGASYLSEEFKSDGFPDVIGIKDFCQGKPVPTYPGIAQ